MGASQSSNQLNIATLNYSGINLSPFQYYCQENYQQLNQLSICFKKILIGSNYSGLTRWEIGNINLKTQRQRYTPIYRKDAGIQNQKIIQQSQFQKKWKQQFDIIKIKKGNQLEWTPEQQEQALKFDLHCFKTIVKYLQLKHNHGKDTKQIAGQYIKFMDKFFAKKTYTDQDQKNKFVIKAIQAYNIDIFFVQQSTKIFEGKLAQIKGQNKETKYLILKNQNSSTLIVINKEKFKKKQPYDHKEILKRLQNKQFFKELNWNGNTTMCMIENFILICVHLSSKEQKNQEQKQKLIYDLQKLRKIYPMCQIIVGGSLNTFISPQQAPTKFKIFPDDEQIFTSSKKRTYIQPQFQKAEELVKQCKDMILSTLPLVNPKVSTITGQDYSLFEYLPNDKHPCANFVVSAKVLKNQ